MTSDKENNNVLEEIGHSTELKSGYLGRKVTKDNFSKRKPYYLSIELHSLCGAKRN